MSLNFNELEITELYKRIWNLEEQVEIYKTAYEPKLLRIEQLMQELEDLYKAHKLVTDKNKELEAKLTIARTALERAVGVITKLSDIDCGCRPCREQCLSETALKIELQERMELCREFLASLEGGDS